MRSDSVEGSELTLGWGQGQGQGQGEEEEGGVVVYDKSPLKDRCSWMTQRTIVNIFKYFQRFKRESIFLSYCSKSSSHIFCRRFQTRTDKVSVEILINM